MSGTADERLGGRYRLLAPIGTGGMAVVWRARDEVLGRDVAVKLLSIGLATDRASRNRIRAEAQAVARLSHPNITSVHDYGESPGDGAPYVVMELLEGELLSARLRASTMSWRRATQIGAQVAAALAAAHERGVVHRDIKPTNVMLTSAGAKVLDFGVAGLAGSPDDDGSDGVVFGTPAYLAPERLFGDVVVPASDVYALGLLLYRCLTDRLPWDADTPTQMIANHVYELPSPLPAISGLPDEVVDLVGRCLAKDPSDRPTAAEAARVLAGATGIHVVMPGNDGLSTQDVAGPAGGGPAGGGPAGGGPAGAGPAGGGPPGGLLSRSSGDWGFDGTTQPRGARAKHRRAVRRAVAALTAAGAAALLITWAVRSSSQDGGAGVAGVRPSAQPACRVNFFIRPEGNGMFAARVTVVNTGKVAQRPWAVMFTFPGSERVTSSDGAAFAQDGTGVRLTGDVALPAGQSITTGLAGLAGGQPGPPIGFALNGTACDTRVIADGFLPPITGVTDPPADLDATHGPPIAPPGRPGGPGGPGGSGFPSAPRRVDVSQQPNAA